MKDNPIYNFFVCTWFISLMLIPIIWIFDVWTDWDTDTMDKIWITDMIIFGFSAIIAWISTPKK